MENTTKYIEPKWVSVFPTCISDNYHLFFFRFCPNLSIFHLFWCNACHQRRLASSMRRFPTSFCINFDHQLVKALYSSTVTLAFCSPAATKNRWWTWSVRHLITSFVKWLLKVTWFVNVRKFNKWFVIHTPPSRPFYFKTAHSGECELGLPCCLWW